MRESNACDELQLIIRHAFYCLSDQMKDRCVEKFSCTKDGFEFYRTKQEQHLMLIVSKLHTADPDL